MVAFGEQTVPSGIAALLIAMMPVWVAIFGRHLPRRAAAARGGRRRSSSGSSASRSSSARPRSAARARSIRSGLAACLISPDRLGERLAVRLAPGRCCRAGRSSRPALQMVVGGARPRRDGGRRPASSRPVRPAADHASSRSLALAYLTVIGSLVAFTVYGWMLRVAPLPLVATYAYVNPVVAVILGASSSASRSTAHDRRRRDHRASPSRSSSPRAAGMPAVRPQADDGTSAGRARNPSTPVPAASAAPTR